MIMKNSGGGEIVQVQGGHILRSTGRKDRHSKVVTSKGPRDRRVRLSAHTAIQFYDVQDRLGYDRPSKAVDWLMKKAKNAIDKLSEIPPWNPTDSTTIMPPPPPPPPPNVDPNAEIMESSSCGYGFHHLPQSMDTQSIAIADDADTMKSFFPVSSSETSSMNFQGYPHEDLCLSLHSLQDPSSSHHHTTADSTDHHHHHHQTLFPVGFEANYPRLASWNNGGNGENREGYMFSSSQAMSMPFQPPQPFVCQSSVLSSQRGPLQSSFLPTVHAPWNEDHPIHSNLHHNTRQPIQQSSISTTQFASSHEALLQFHNEEEHHGLVLSNKPSSSASPNSHH